jgi:hypothetical protein
VSLFPHAFPGAFAGALNCAGAGPVQAMENKS